MEYGEPWHWLAFYAGHMLADGFEAVHGVGLPRFEVSIHVRIKNRKLYGHRPIHTENVQIALGDSL